MEEERDSGEGEEEWRWDAARWRIWVQRGAGLEEMRERRVGRCFSRDSFQRVSLRRSCFVCMVEERSVGEVKGGRD